MAGRRRGRGGDEHVEHENEERWLLTYADMITLLLALFMVLFAISSVNTSKFEALSKSLEEAFKGVTDGGQSVIETGGSTQAAQNVPEPPIPSIVPITPEEKAQALAESEAVEQEQEDFERLKRQIDEYARTHGLAEQVESEIARRGLVVRLLTDQVLFSSGSAELEARGKELLDAIGRMLASEVRHPIQVEGHTDSRPISTSLFPTNWELSTARSARVVRVLINRGVAAGRLKATGEAHMRPLESNATAAGRARNRRVEIVLTRLNNATTEEAQIP